MPQIRSKQILGETPINPNDIVNKSYVDNLISGRTGGSINIEDEGNLILSGATILNFIGIDVKAESALSGTTRKVNIYIPPPTYSSHFNSNDGTTNATVSPQSTTNRYISLPTTPSNPYDIGDWSGGEQHTTIRTSIVPNYSTAGVFSIYDLTTTFIVTIYGADGTTPLSSYEIPLTSDTTLTQNNITITVTNFDTDSDRYKANITISINIDGIISDGGRFSVRLTHNNSTDGTYTFTQNNIFKDKEPLSANISGDLIILPYIPSIKQISGVYYYTLGSEWHVNLPNINNLNSNSYPLSQQLRIQDNDLIFSREIINAHGEGGSYYTFVGGTWTQQYNTNNAEYDKLDWTTDEVNQTNWNHGSGTIDTPVATGTIYDWSLVGTVNSSTYNYLIDTFVDSSDRNSEMFRTESNSDFPRLTSGLVNWDETESLITADGGNGLQVLGNRLVYPQYNFEPLNPNSGSTQPNYVGETGDKSYYRIFEANGDNMSNGTIQFSDYNLLEADLVNVTFEISINSGSSWYTLNSPYTIGILSDGDGCREDDNNYGLGVGTINSNSLRFTLGQVQVSPPLGTSTYIILKITYNSSASDKYIGGIDIVSGNWI